MKVLVVDDDATIRRILRRLVGAASGVEVIEAANGMDGLVQVETGHPDLIVTDVNMPILDGLGLVQAIRSSASHSDIPVVAVSASSERTQVAKLIELGIVEYLLKPLDIAETSKRLGKVIEAIRIRPKAERHALVEGAARSRLLLVEPDPNFRQLFKSIVEGRYDVIEAVSGPQGLALAVEQRPRVACLADGLGLLNEQLLCRHLK